MTGRVRAARMVPVAATAWAVAITAVLAPETAGAVALAAFAGAVGATAIATRRRGTVAGVVAVALAAACAVAAQVAIAQPARADIAQLVGTGGRTVDIAGTVTGRMDTAASGDVWFDVVADHVRAGERALATRVPVRIGIAREAAPALRGVDLGAGVRVRGAALAARAGERDVFVLRASDAPQLVAAPHGPWGVLAALRDGLRTSAHSLPGAGGALVPGLAVGDTSAVDADLEEAMRASALSHLTAVSGANCAIVVGGAFGLAALMRAPRGARVALAVAALALFVLLVTPEPSVVRAAAMAAIAMLAVALGRAGAGLAVLCAAVALLLVIDPWLALELGFALSAVATASLLVLARPLTRGLARFAPLPLAAAVAVPLAAQIACGPLLVLIDPRVPLLGVVANMLAAPAAPVATIAGFLACLAAPVPLVRDGLTALAWVPASWIAGVADAIARAPAQSLPWPDGPGGAVALGIVGAAIVGALVPGRAARRHARIARWVCVVIVATCGGVAAGHAALTGAVSTWTTPRAWQIAVCDVGQGDAVLVRDAGAVALVDTGPDPGALRSCLERFAVAHVDLLVLTHFDADHSGGATALLGRAGRVVHGPADRDGERLLARFAHAGARVEAVAAGDAGTLGDARWRVLWPRRSTDQPGNDASVVLRVEGGAVPSIVLLGDLSATAQVDLRASARPRAVDVVKVAHHGSADQDPGLYDALAARVALIPVGVHNEFGHPRASLLGLLRADGALVARTDEDGSIALSFADGALHVWRERRAP